MEEFTFRFNRRTSRSRGLVFRRLLEQIAVTDQVPEKNLIHQASLAAWWNGREAATPAFAPIALQELAGKLEALGQAGYAYAFIDTPPAITESIRAVVAQADFVLIPTRPSPHDLRAVGSTVELALGAQRPFAFSARPRPI